MWVSGALINPAPVCSLTCSRQNVKDRARENLPADLSQDPAAASFLPEAQVTLLNRTTISSRVLLYVPKPDLCATCLGILGT